MSKKRTLPSVSSDVKPSISVAGNTNNINVSGGLVPSRETKAQININLFTQILEDILDRDKRGKFNRFVDILLQRNRTEPEKVDIETDKQLSVSEEKELEQISTLSELKTLIKILADPNFYTIPETEKQEKYIRVMLDYLAHEVPQSYKFILERFFPDDHTVGNTYGTDVIAKLIIQRLAGDSSTDAPPPEKKKKPKRKN